MKVAAQTGWRPDGAGRDAHNRRAGLAGQLNIRLKAPQI